LNKRRVNVLLLVDTLKGGGVEEWVKEIVRSMDRERFAPTVCYLTDLRYKDGASYADEIGRYAEVYHIGFGKPLSTEKAKSFLHSKSRVRTLLQWLYLPVSLSHLPLLYRLIKKKRINVIHSFMHYSLVLGAIAGRLCRIPVVYQVTESRAQLKEGRPSWLFRAMGFLEPHVDVFYTGLSQKELMESGVPEGKIKPIRGAIDIEGLVRIMPEENPLLDEFSLRGSFPVLLSVGRFTPEKGHVHAIAVLKEVLKDYPDARLIILGDGWEYEKIKDIASAAGLLDRMLLPGFRADLENFYSIADVYLRTNLVETGTLSSFRAMAYGLPVVGFKNPAKECIIDGTSGLLVPAGDSICMAGAVKTLAKDERLRSALGEKARAYAEENLDIRKAVRDFEEEYMRLAR